MNSQKVFLSFIFSVTISILFGFTDVYGDVATISGVASYTVTTNSATGTSCPSSSYSSNGLGDATMELGTSGSSSSCSRGALQWSITGIAARSKITDTSLSSHSTTVTNGQNCDIVALPVNLATINAASQWGYIGNSTTILSNQSQCATTKTNSDFDLGSIADSALQTAVNNGASTWAIGLKFTSETRDGSTHTTTFQDVDSSLQVIYTPPCGAPTSLNTAVVSNQQINLSWTAPAGCTPTGYGVWYESPTGGGFSKLINNTGTTTISYSATGLNPSTQYNFKVYAWNVASYGSNSTASATTTLSGMIFDVNEFDGTTAITSGNLILKNTTNTTTYVLDSNGQTSLITGLSGNQNVTVKEITDNFVVNKTRNFSTFTSATKTINTNIYDVNCALTGSSADVTLKINQTTGHTITNMTRPTCNSSNVISWNATFSKDGTSGASFTSSMIAEILNTTAYGKNATHFFVNGTEKTTTFSSPKITSTTFTVGQGITSYLVKFYLWLDPKPEQVTGLSATGVSTSQIDLSWNAPDSGVSSITGYKIMESSDGSSYSVLVSDTGSTSTSYSRTALPVGTTRYYQVAALNSYGTGELSSSASGTASSQQSSGGGGGGGGSLIQQMSNGLTLNLSPGLGGLINLGETKTFDITFTWNVVEEPTLILKNIETPTSNFDSLSIVGQSIPNEGILLKDGKGTFKVTVSTPSQKCDPANPTARCVNLKTYTIPIQFDVADSTGANYGPYSAVLQVEIVKQQTSGIIIIVLVMVAVTGAIIQLARTKKPKTNSPKHHKNAVEKAIKNARKSPNKPFRLFGKKVTL